MIPKDVRKTNSGAPDMRYTESRDFVQRAAQSFPIGYEGRLPRWLPCRGGEPDLNTASGRWFQGARPALSGALRCSALTRPLRVTVHLH